MYHIPQSVLYIDVSYEDFFPSELKNEDINLQ